MNFYQGQVNIANMALTALGLDMIESFEQNNSPAKLMKLYYPIILQRILSEYDWNFARRTVDITQVEPVDEYKNYDYAFGLPEDFVAVQRIRPEQLYWEIYDNDTLRCNTPAERTKDVLDPDNYENVLQETEYYMELTYTKDDVDPMKMSPGFAQYLAYSLAQETGFMLTGDLNVTQMVLNFANSYQAIAHVEDASRTKRKEYGEKKPWFRDDAAYYARRYRDGGPNATEDFDQ